MRAPAAILLALAFLAGTGAEAGSGYETDFDYPGQGDDWYGRMAPPRPARDFAPAFLDLIASGEDFCLGYDRFFDRLRLGPPLVRTQTSHSDHDFLHGPADASMPCIEGAAPPPDCDDGNACTSDRFDPASGRCQGTPMPDGTSCANAVFCDGSEACLGGACLSGPPPACDDGDPCTADSCDFGPDACVFAPPAPPAPPQDLGVVMSAPPNPFAIVSWDPVPLADFYNLYRATDRTLGDLSCLVAFLPDESAMDDGLLPPLAGVHYLLATSETVCGGESSAGDGTFGRRPMRPAPEDARPDGPAPAGPSFAADRRPGPERRDDGRAAEPRRGTPCRGAVLLDGGRILTPALLEAVDRMSRGYPGFFFGPYDLIGPSEEASGAGRDLRVIDLNGVTSESTGIHDPGSSLLDACRVLSRQWHLAFEIGAGNRRRGVRPSGLGGLLRLLRNR